MKFETKRLIIRALKLKDVDDVVDGLNNLNVLKNLGGIPYPYKKKDAIKFIQLSKKNKYKFGIYLKFEKKIIGVISYSVNLKNFTVSSGSWINEKYWMNGYVTEAKIPVIDYFFNNLKLRKLTSSVFLENLGSQKALLKLGYKKEGLQKKEIICKATGKVHDLVLYGLFKEDYLKSKKKIKVNHFP